MLKFFRRIRRNLLDKGHLRKYLIYAVGEILLVVIGILIALQINNSNEHKKSQARLEIYLDQIRRDISEDIDQLDAVAQKLDTCQELSSVIEQYFHNKHIQNPRLFRSGTFCILTNIDFDPKLQGIEGLKSSGTMEVMSNKQLEDLIYQYYSLIKKIDKVETEYNSFIFNLELELKLNGFLTKFAPFLVRFENQYIDQVTYENISAYSPVEVIFLQTIYGTDEMKNGYQKLKKIGFEIQKILDKDQS